MNPHRSTIHDRTVHTQLTVNTRKTHAAHHLQQRRTVARVQHHLVAVDSCTGDSRHRVRRLHAVEKRHLVTSLIALVQRNHRIRQIRHRRILANHQTPHVQVAHQHTPRVLRHRYARHAATSNLIRSQHTATVQPHALGHIHLHHVRVRLDKRVIVVHPAVQTLKTLLQRLVKLPIHSRHVTPLRPDLHLRLRTLRHTRLLRLIHHRSILGLPINQLTHLATQLRGHTIHLCHNQKLLSLNSKL